MRFLFPLFILASVPTALHAAPGLGGEVYGARVEKGVSEAEIRYGRLTGRSDNGEDVALFELSHAVSNKTSFGIVAETEREPHSARKLEAFSIEAIHTLGRIEALDLDVAGYAEYEVVRHGADAAELKLLLQRTRGPFDARFNLIAEKPLANHRRVEFGYAASADWKVIGDIRLGGEAFGDLGTTKDFLGREEHFAGPMVHAEIEGLPGKGELEIKSGYLFALGAAKDDARGQFRLVMGYEFRF